MDKTRTVVAARLQHRAPEAGTSRTLWRPTEWPPRTTTRVAIIVREPSWTLTLHQTSTYTTTRSSCSLHLATLSHNYRLQWSHQITTILCTISITITITRWQEIRQRRATLRIGQKDSRPNKSRAARATHIELLTVATTRQQQTGRESTTSSSRILGFKTISKAVLIFGVCPPVATKSQRMVALVVLL